jgi:hypothetical protein
MLGLPALESKAVSWVPELDNAPGRQCMRQIFLEVSPPLRPPSWVEFGSGVWQRSGSGFSGDDERNPEGFEKDEHEF